MQETGRPALHQAVPAARPRQLLKYRGVGTLPRLMVHDGKCRLYTGEAFDHDCCRVVVELAACHTDPGEDTDDDAVEDRPHR